MYYLHHHLISLQGAGGKLRGFLYRDSLCLFGWIPFSASVSFGLPGLLWRQQVILRIYGTRYLDVTTGGCSGKVSDWPGTTAFSTDVGEYEFLVRLGLMP